MRAARKVSVVENGDAVRALGFNLAYALAREDQDFGLLLIEAPPNALTPAPAANAEPCRRRSWSGWRWHSYSSGYSSYSSSDRPYRNEGSYYSRRPSNSVSTALAPTARSGQSAV